LFALGQGTLLLLLDGALDHARLAGAEREADLDRERIAAIDGGLAADGGVEVALDLLIEAREDRLLADRRQAVGRRVHDGRLLDRLVELFRGVAVDLPDEHLGIDARLLADLTRRRGR